MSAVFRASTQAVEAHSEICVTQAICSDETVSGARYSEHSGSPRHWCLSPCSRTQ